MQNELTANPNTHAFVASPEIVTAIAISGKLTFNPVTDTLVNSEGVEVKLAEPQGLNLPPEGIRYMLNRDIRSPIIRKIKEK